MADLFGTYAGLYDGWQSSEDGLIYDGIRRHAAYQAVDSMEGCWIVEPDVAIAAVTAAQCELGVEGYDTRWAIDGSKVFYAPSETGGFKPVERDDQGRYLLPRSEFPDVADQVRRDMVDRVIGTGGASVEGTTYSSVEDWDAPTEAWSPEPIRGIENDQQATSVAVTVDAPDQAHIQRRAF